MINIEDKEKCCVCSSCANICPYNCISLISDKEGFLYPYVDKDKCIECGMCEKACPILYKSNIVRENVAYISFANENNIRTNSSSGGIFPVIAEFILDNKGIVFGAAFDLNFEVHHIGIYDKKDLSKLMGSKYVQSDMGTIYKEARDELLCGRKVLFSGTPCQIAGLKKFLKKEYENLFTIDLLCHGVPSPKLWEKYLRDQEELYGASIENISMRKKTLGWRLFSMNIQFDNGDIYSKNLKEDRFMRLFLNNICLRPSCYNCEFKDVNRNSDITLGDCWGIEKYMPYMDDDMGTSVIITHSKKGQEILRQISGRITIQEAILDKAVRPDSDSRKSVNRHVNISEFYKKLNDGESTIQLIELIKPSLYEMLVNKLKKLIKKINGKLKDIGR